VREAPDGRNLLISLFPLVKRMALKMRSHLPASVEVDDLVGAGALGLLDAADKFDSSKHAKLETYARYRIRGSMLDSLRALDPASRGARNKSRKVEKLFHELANQLGRPASDEEMAGALGVDLQEWYGILEEVQAVAKDGDYLVRRSAGAVVRQLTDRVEAHGPDASRADSASGGTGPFELLLRREQREILDRALASLPARDRAVMTLYYQHELTMGQIATRLGVDESRISQIHSQALARLRRRVQSRLGDPSPANPARPLPGGAVEAHAPYGRISGFWGPRGSI
jgi:RNA polymerase sigma factor for flagellar operon FliA